MLRDRAGDKETAAAQAVPVGQAVPATARPEVIRIVRIGPSAQALNSVKGEPPA